MAIEIGALLGQLDGTQSFDEFDQSSFTVTASTFGNISSWTISNCSPLGTLVGIRIESTFVHSSNFNLRITFNVDSAQAALNYDYMTSNDTQQRWWMEVNTHKIVSYFWSQIVNAFSSNAIVTLNNASIDITTSTYTRHRIETYISSTDNLNLTFHLQPDGGGYNSIIDDVLTTVDAIELYPERNLVLLDEVYKNEHTTIGGANPAYLWGFNKKWQLPLRNLEETQAKIINQWWQDNRPLLFTWDTSDTTQQFICTLANNTAPMTRFVRPYHDEWEGTLNINAIDTSLIF